MAIFSKQDLMNELKTIFLFEADHILMGAGEKAAEEFIGFPAGDRGEYCHMDPANVNLDRFPIAGAFDRGYDYAYFPSVKNTLGEGEVQDLNVFMAGTPRAGGIHSGGETHAFMTSDGLCQRVADTVFARWKLEWNEYNDGETFTTRELALLANMTEGAVRNAVSDKGSAGLKAIPGTKNPVLIEHADALHWLSGRRGFVPTPSSAGSDRFFLQNLKEVTTSDAMGLLICQALNGTRVEVAKGLGWSLETLEHWLDGVQVFDEQRASELAAYLEVDEPFFVGKTLEVVRRRDALKNKEA